MFCQKCGNEVVDEAVVCPSCGCALGKSAKKDAEEERLNVGLLVLSIAIPIAGVILWPVKNRTAPKAAKIYGLAGIAAWVCYALFLL